MRTDIGTNIGLQAIGIGIATGATLFGAHQAGMQRVRDAAEAREQEQYNNALNTALNDAEKLGELAIRLAQELAAERTKNESLTRALYQRQALIDRIRNH